MRERKVDRVTGETGWERHNEAVERLTNSYARIPDGAPVRLAKRTTNLFRARATTSAPGLDVSGLGGVIEVDAEAGTADVQGMCTYEDLVDATLAYGMIPYVVPQLRTITLGGAVTGMGIEATSFRRGLPHVIGQGVAATLAEGVAGGHLVGAPRAGPHLRHRCSFDPHSSVTGRRELALSISSYRSVTEVDRCARSR
jgi:hypothetical protein